MMTLSQIRDKIRLDLKMQEEPWLSDIEINKYINDAIDEAEAEIHTTYEDYFLTKEYMYLVNGKRRYALPTDIYANKIRKIYYNSENDKYVIQRVKKLDNIPNIDDEDYYRYLIVNSANISVSSVDSVGVITLKAEHGLSVGDTAVFYSSNKSTVVGSGTVAATATPTSLELEGSLYTYITAGCVLRTVGSFIELYPKSRETSTENVEMWYIRNARYLVNDTDYCDIPEFEQFVIQRAKVECIKQDIGNPLLTIESQQLEKERDLMLVTLSNMVPDEDNFVLQDTSFYCDFDV